MKAYVAGYAVAHVTILKLQLVSWTVVRPDRRQI
jgi:hypothetical protein